MECVNTMKMEILSKSSNEGFARASVAAFIAQLDPTIEEISDIKTSVSEAVTNSIVHGYGNNIGKINIIVKIFDTGKVRIEIKDKGIGIEDVEVAMQPLYTTSTTGDRAGMVFSIMGSFMDNLKVISKQGKGTKVIMEKYIKRKR